MTANSRILGTYEKSQLADDGDVRELTASVWGCGNDDASAKSFSDFFKAERVPFGSSGCKF